MVTKKMLAEEVRLHIGQQSVSSANSSEVSALRKQISKMDPAHKGIRFRGFKDASLSKRIESIEKILKEVGVGLGDKPEFVCEHIDKGPQNEQVLNAMCMVTFQSNSLREIVFKNVQGKPFYDNSRNELKIDRAKTAFQLGRNSVLRRAADVLKKDARCKNKEIQVEWRLKDSKDKAREVQVDGVTAFRQLVDEPSGCFLGSFSDLTV